jgi:glc operon protein GlcG
VVGIRNARSCQPVTAGNTPLARLYLSQLWAVLEEVLAAGGSLAQDGRGRQAGQPGRVMRVEPAPRNREVRPTLSAGVARRLIDAAISEAAQRSVPVTVVTVDESGVVKALHRMDGAPLVSVQTAQNKAYAAAAIGMPTDDFYSAIESDGAAVASFAARPGLALIGGGLPVLADGQVAGAIGVAGAMTADEDRRIAAAAVDLACS